MKKYRGWLVFVLSATLCAGTVWLILQATAEYPISGEPVSYQVNQVEGFELAIEKPAWSPLKGYTIRWMVAADTKEVYSFNHAGTGFEFLERCIDGTWHRLEHSQDIVSFNAMEFALGGGEGASLQGSVVQKYAYYGTRLEPGNYRLVLEMNAQDGTPYYLAAEFDVG